MIAGAGLRAETLIQEFRSSWPPRSFLARLEPAALNALALGRRGTIFDASQPLLVEGDPASAVFLLISAAVKVTVQIDHGLALLAVRVGGDIIGELAAADGGLRSATVTAARETIAVAIPTRDFTETIDRFPAARRLLAAELTRKLRAANRRRADFSAYKVEVRVARVLSELVEEYGQPTGRGPGERILRIGLSQGELATLIGASEAPVTSALTSMRRTGVLEWGYRTVTIRDVDALRAVGLLKRR
jgi:CRP/FNR family transcriptional regulator, cyclic AMP receptor protein